MTLRQANELRLAQAEIRRLVESRMNEIVAYLAGRPDLSPAQFRNSLIAQTNLVVSQYGDIAASMAAEWYDDMRLAEGVAGSFRAVPQVSPYGADAVDGMVRRAVAPMFDEVPDVSAVMRTVVQNAGKYVLGAARETVRRNSFIDPRGTGFQRVARPGACDFCIMLVGRGAVYKKETAFFASHGDCNCAAVPSWDPDAPEVDVELYEASRRTTGMSDAERSRHNSAIRDYMEHNREDDALMPMGERVREKLGVSTGYKRAKFTTQEAWSESGVQLSDVIARQGWGGPIEQLADTDFDAFRSTEPTIFRGVSSGNTGSSARQLNAAFLNEDIPWTGDGVYGPGWYTTTDVATANQYAGKASRFTRDSTSIHIGDSVVEMKLRPGLRIADIDQIPGRNVSKGLEAAKLGYDAIRIPSPRPGEDYYLVVNRSAVVARRLASGA